jgi:pimeloyl-ACP methyl ester carboxylesterase
MTRSSDGVEIAYETHGARVGTDAPSVVLVHGWAGNRSYWDQQVAFLAEQLDVIALDLGGHGESGFGRADWTLEAFGDDVLAVVDEAGAQKVALVGHSMGGDAILHAARQLGDRVIGLVWVDVVRSLGNEPRSSPEDVEAFLAPFVDDYEGAVDRFVRNMFPADAGGALVDHIASDMATAPREAALGSLRYALNREPAILRNVAEIAAPIVAINPDIQPTDADSMRRHGVETIVLNDVGHFLMIEDPGQFNPLLAQTLASFSA